MVMNGTNLSFPLSLKDIEAVLGKPDQVVKKESKYISTFTTMLVLYLNIRLLSESFKRNAGSILMMSIYFLQSVSTMVML